MIASVVELANNQIGEMLVAKGADVSYQGDKTDVRVSMILTNFSVSHLLAKTR